MLTPVLGSFCLYHTQCKTSGDVDNVHALF